VELIRAQYGQDEFRFAEPNRKLAEELAASLPGLRKLAHWLVGFTGFPSVRVVISDAPPRARDLFSLRGTSFFWYPPITVLVALLITDNSWPAVYRMPIAGALLTFFFALPVYSYIRYMRLVRRVWPHASGITTQGPGLYPTIAIHWPRPPRSPAVEALVLPVQDWEWTRSVAAHEYAHCMLRHGRSRSHVKAWLDEGFASWFAEQAVNRSFWRPEARQCVAEPEGRGDVHLRSTPDEEHYIRLMARYYWEVRTLAVQGKLGIALRTPNKELEKIRPKLSV